MKKELELKLVEKYPNLFRDYNKSPRETLICFGCECGNGWYDLLDELFEKLSKYDEAILVQVKEKFGELRVYYNCTSNDDDEAIQKLIDKAVLKSSQTCEVCGGKGKIVERGFWLSTLCNNCLT